MSRQETIETCSFCQGKGYKISRDYIPGHNLEVNERKVECHQCEGSGRLLHVILDTFKPYTPEEL